jgi:hypothetical protein
MEQNDILSIISIVLAVCGTIFGIFNHKRIRSRCNNTEVVASIDVENTTPLREDLKINLPPMPPTPKPKTVLQMLEEERKQ